MNEAKAFARELLRSKMECEFFKKGSAGFEIKVEARFGVNSNKVLYWVLFDGKGRYKYHYKFTKGEFIRVTNVNFGILWLKFSSFAKKADYEYPIPMKNKI